MGGSPLSLNTMDATILDAVRSGDRRALSRAISQVEQDGVPTGLPAPGSVIGVTGPPGAGKSTLISGLVEMIRSRGDSVAVLAVDPSSPVTGGAILGDRIRMQGHIDDEGVYIRSMATRGHLGGLAPATGEAVALLDAAGFDRVVVETVGVGQSEVEIASTADLTLVVLNPGAGDVVQAAKAGVMEIGDVFVINKADQDGAGRLAGDVRGMLRSDPSEGRRATKVLRTVASRGEGVDLVVDEIIDRCAYLTRSGRLVEQRRVQALRRIRDAVMDQVAEAFDQWSRESADEVESVTEQALAQDLTPVAAARRVLETWASWPSRHRFALTTGDPMSTGHDDATPTPLEERMITTTASLDAPIAAVWRTISDFPGIMAWHPMIESCEADGADPGALRRLRMKGREVVDRLDVLDAESHVVQYSVAEGRPQTLGTTGRIQLEPLDEERTQVTWVTTLPDLPGAADLVPELTGYYATRIEHLRQAVSG